MQYSKLIARMSSMSFRLLEKVYNFSNAVLSGFWLGIMDNKSLDEADELHYKKAKLYYRDSYNSSGLFDWEKKMILKHFSNARSILVIAAGGGREVLALIKMGYEVDAYECNEQLVKYGNSFLSKNDIDSKIKILSRNAVPYEIKQYDGIILGWGLYTLIRGYEARVSFLKKLHPFMDKETILMISFWTMEKKGKQQIITRKISNFFRFILRKEKSETGDALEPNFGHYFSHSEIVDEVSQVKFKMLDYYDTKYGCCICKFADGNTISTDNKIFPSRTISL